MAKDAPYQILPKIYSYPSKYSREWGQHPGGFLENICTGMLKVDFRMMTISIPVYCKKKKKKKKEKKKKKKKTRSLYLTCMTKQPTHL